MAKSSTGRGKSGGTNTNKANFDKLAKAAMSREMLAAGLTAAAAAIAASPKARKAIRDAGLDAADSASQAATAMMTKASKLGSLIAEAVADAAQRVLSGKWADEAGGTAVTATSKPVAKRAAPRKPVPPARRRLPRRLPPSRRQNGRLRSRALQPSAAPARARGNVLRPSPRLLPRADSQWFEHGAPDNAPGPLLYGKDLKSVRWRGA